VRPADPQPPGSEEQTSATDASPDLWACPAPAEPWPAPMVAHVCMVVSLIEGRRVSREEIREMLAKVLRQHSIGRRRKIDHAVAWLIEHPP